MLLLLLACRVDDEAAKSRDTADTGRDSAGAPDGDSDTDGGGDTDTDTDQDSGADTAPDAGEDTAPDSGADSGTESPRFSDFVYTTERYEADDTCLGSTWDAPDSVCITDHAVSGTVVDFQTSDAVPHATWRGWTTDDPTTAADATGTSGSDGAWSAALPSCTPLALATEATGAVPLYQQHVVYAWDRLGLVSDDLWSLDTGTTAIIAAVLGVAWAPATAIVTGQVFDCAGDPVAGAQMFLHDGAGNVPGSPQVFYFNDTSFPDPSQTSTAAGVGFYVWLDVEPGTYTLEAWGYDGTTHVELAAAEVVTFADSASLINLHVGHDDGAVYPESCYWACDEID